MNLTISEQGEKTLTAKQGQVQCCECSEQVIGRLYYCPKDKRLYCHYCMSHNKGCSAIYEDHHNDYPVDRVVYE